MTDIREPPCYFMKTDKTAGNATPLQSATVQYPKD